MSELDRNAVAPAGGRRLGLRIGVGVAAVVLAAGTVGAAALAPGEVLSVAAPSVTVAPSTGEQTIACPGPVARLSDDTGAGATDISTVGAVVTAQGTNPLGVTPSSEDLDQPDNTGDDQRSTPFRLNAPSESGGERLVLGAAQSQQVSESELVGLAAAACQEPALESWLVGGSTKTGRTSFVYLSNPNDVAATVDLTLYTEHGTLSAPGSRGLLVPAGGQRVLSLAGLAPNESSPVVRVQSTGGAVAAWMQQSIVRGLQPGGVELTGSVPAPATEHVIPGVEIVGTTAIAERLVQSANNEDMQAVLRVFPQGSEATAMVATFRSESIGVPDVTVPLDASAGLVTDYVLRDIPDGTYTVTVTADHPVLVAARSSVVSGNDIDFAWYQSVQPQTAPFVVTAPNGPSARMHVYNPGTTEAVLDIATPVGQTASFTIPAGTAAGIPLGANVYTASVGAPLVVSVGYLGGGLISAFAVAPPGALDGELTVYP